MLISWDIYVNEKCCVKGKNKIVIKIDTLIGILYCKLKYMR